MAENHIPPQALSDIRVLDFTHYISGPYCTKLMADYGAKVLKVERTDGGDMARMSGPFPATTLIMKKAACSCTSTPTSRASPST